MRVSPVGWAFDSEARVEREAGRSASCTHDHPEGIKGAQAIATAVLLARHGADCGELRRRISERYGYDLGGTVDDIRPGYHFDPTCLGTVPAALIACFDSSDFEDAVRNAVSLGGDSDTLACMSGSVAEALYGGVPESIEEQTLSRLPHALASILLRFRNRLAPA
jgi:ADP-ribosylglycohydrolase